MKNSMFRSTHKLQIITSLFAILMVVSLISSCSKADATTKKEKTKESKTKEPEVDETTETSDSTDADKKEESDADEPGAETAKTDDDEKKAESKEPAKPGEKKKSSHDDKKSAKSPEKGEKVSADDIWKELVKGNKRFMAGKHTAVDYTAARKTLVKGQHPEVIVLGCADSRVPPEFVFDKNLGELFVIRDAGNIPDKYALGSIEYAVEHLHAKAIVVMGHESCGAVAAAVSGEKMPSGNLTAIVDSISPAFEGSKTCLIGGESNLSCVELNVKQSAKDILSRSPMLRKAISEGHLAVIRAVYKMETGEVIRLD